MRYLILSICAILLYSGIGIADEYEIQWADRIDNTWYDDAQGVAVDKSGNIVITGSIYKPDTADHFGYFTVKYDALGSILWADTIMAEGCGLLTCGRSVTIDGSGSIIVAGPFCIAGEDSYDYLTVKYDPSGNILWADTIDNGADDQANGVAVDGTGNIVVTGTSYIAGNADYFTVKYDALGSILWADTIDNSSSDRAKSVAVDHAGNIVVTGVTTINFRENYFTVKYDSVGNILWTDTIDIKKCDHPEDVAVDNVGNIIVVGAPSPTPAGYDSFDYFIVKYDSTGNILWTDTIDNGGEDWARGVATDNSDNIIVTGKSLGSYFTVKYTPSGDIVWIDTLKDSSGEWTYANDVAVDDSGNIVITGVYDAGANYDYWTVKYAPKEAIEERKSEVQNFLYPNIPNPFTKKTVIKFKVRSSELKSAQLQIYDISGRCIRIFPITPSPNNLISQVVWDGKEESGESARNGVYFYKLKIDDFISTRKAILVR